MALLHDKEPGRSGQQYKKTNWFFKLFFGFFLQIVGYNIGSNDMILVSIQLIFQFPESFAE